jgi:hypothetical protein
MLNIMIQQSTTDLSMCQKKPRLRIKKMTLLCLTQLASQIISFVNLPTLIYLVYTTQSCTMFHEHLEI